MLAKEDTLSTKTNNHTTFQNVLISLWNICRQASWRDWLVSGNIAAATLIGGAIAVYMGNEDIKSQVVNAAIGAGVGFFTVKGVFYASAKFNCDDLRAKIKLVDTHLTEKLNLLALSFAEETPNYSELKTLIGLIQQAKDGVLNRTFVAKNKDEEYKKLLTQFDSISDISAYFSKTLGSILRNELQGAGKEIKDATEYFTELNKQFLVSDSLEHADTDVQTIAPK